MVLKRLPLPENTTGQVDGSTMSPESNSSENTPPSSPECAITELVILL